MYLTNNTLHLETSETGARIISLQLDERNFFFPQQIVNINNRYKLRGGMHLCSPIFGEKEDFSVPKHGGLRDVVWQIENHGKDFAIYLHKFNDFGYSLTYRVHYRLLENRLEIITHVTNHLSRIAFELGWHPYFLSPYGAIISFIDRCEPIVVNQVYNAEILKADQEIQIRLPSTGIVTLHLFDQFKTGYACVWTDWQQKYVCVEPLISLPNDFATDKGIFLEQDESFSATFQMQFDKGTW